MIGFIFFSLVDWKKVDFLFLKNKKIEVSIIDVLGESWILMENCQK